MRTVSDLLRFGREVCNDLAQAERREWWLANGRGAYAAGTIAGTLTRRYHGLLIAPVDPPLGRRLLLAKADATLIDGGRRVPLFANRWADGVIHPEGHLNIASFALDGRMPVWRFDLGGAVLEQRIWMEYGADTTCVAFRLLPGAKRPLALQLTLLVNARDHHAGTRPWEFDPEIAATGSALRVRYPDRFELQLATPGGTVEPRRDWYENFELAIERERGLPARDNHLCAGVASYALQEDRWVGLVASVGSAAAIDLETSLQRSLARDTHLLADAGARVPVLREAPPWIERLVLAADDFVFARPLPEVPDGESVIAGYPWFGDWGRDTMIALPGLTLAVGRNDTAARILRTFARFVDRGMLPNVFPGSGERPEYNTVDAALWYLEAWRAYVAATGDLSALKEVFPVLQDIVDWHARGTRYGIGMDGGDGLLRAGEAGVQLTWMDAKVGDWVVTPRIGKPVEISALWFNSLSAMAELAGRIGASAERYRELAQRCRAGFRRFVRAHGAGLYDVIDGPQGDDASLRPNQIFAVSLPHSPLSREEQAAVLAAVRRELLTPYGLRSLDQGNPAYRPHYLGGVWERDGAYHQGPVWAWLLGHYALAQYRVEGDAAAALQVLEGLQAHLGDAGLGTVSEIFDGAPPHAPRGAPAQAWSVACTLEAWWRLTEALRANDARGAKAEHSPSPPTPPPSTGRGTAPSPRVAEGRGEADRSAPASMALEHTTIGRRL
jgi:4-alpha-glucanotransferase